MFVPRILAINPTLPRAPIDCALALDEWSETLLATRAGKGVSLGATRIGVHAGPAIVGNFGGGRLFDYTAYGDTINAAARLEAANRPTNSARGLRQRRPRPSRAPGFSGPRHRRSRAAGPHRAIGAPMSRLRGCGAGLNRLRRGVREVGSALIKSAVAAFAVLVGVQPDAPARAISSAAVAGRCLGRSARHRARGRSNWLWTDVKLVSLKAPLWRSTFLQGCELIRPPSSASLAPSRRATPGAPRLCGRRPRRSRPSCNASARTATPYLW